MTLKAISSPELQREWVRQAAGSSLSARSARSHPEREESQQPKNLLLEFAVPTQKAMSRSPGRSQHASQRKASSDVDSATDEDRKPAPNENQSMMRHPGSPRFSLSYSDDEPDDSLMHPAASAMDVLVSDGIDMQPRDDYMQSYAVHPSPGSFNHPSSFNHTMGATLQDAFDPALMPHSSFRRESEDPRASSGPDSRFQAPVQAAAAPPEAPYAARPVARPAARQPSGPQPEASSAASRRSRPNRNGRRKPAPVAATRHAVEEIKPSQRESEVATTGRARLALNIWYNRLNELNRYRLEHGNCNVPQKYPPNPKLGIWVNKQRMEKKFMDDGITTSMTEDRFLALERIGFIWAKRKGQHSWDAKYEELKDFIQEHGHANVPTKFEENKALGRWVSTQRSQYKLWIEGKRTHMTTTRYNRLCEVGFTFDMLNKKEESSTDSE